METFEERFWSKVDVGVCWEWTASLSKTGGYGKYTIPHRDGTGRSKYVYAHRHAYETLVGPIPDGMQLDHLCRNRRCVNPDHLEAVTPRTNIKRGMAGDLKTHCKRGHKFAPENTSYTNTGWRVCLACRRQWDKERYLKNGRR